MKLMTRMRLIITGFCAALPLAPASATNFSCQVYPRNYLGINGGGLVVVGVGNLLLQVCNVSGGFGGIPPEVCTSWYSSLLTMRIAGKTGWFYFSSDNSMNGGITSCEDFTMWDLRAPYHFEIAD